MQGSPAQQVNVQVVDGLSPVVAGIDDGAEAAGQSLTAGDARRNQVKISQQLLVFGGCFCQRGDVLARYNQHMRGSLGMDIPEGVSPIVLKYLIRRNFAGHDFAK